MKKTIFTFLLIASTAMAQTTFGGKSRLTDNDSIEFIPQASLLSFDPNFVLRAFTNLTPTGKVSDEKMCSFVHDNFARERALPELSVASVKFRSTSDSGAKYGLGHQYYVDVVEITFNNKNESIKPEILKMICAVRFNSGQISIGEFRTMLSSIGGTLTISEPVPF